MSRIPGVRRAAPAPGPLRRSSALEPDAGLNYAAINATTSADVLAFPPPGFKAAEYRHRIGSGARRFELAGRALMTWGALRSAGFAVDEVRAEAPTSAHAGQPRFLPDGTPWITAGMTAVVAVADAAEVAGPVKVVSVVDEPGRIGYVYGSMPGHSACGERFLLLEHDREDGVWVTLRSIWESQGGRLARAGRMTEARQRRLDERIVRALHPSNAA